jgi:hypothetical protein
VIYLYFRFGLLLWGIRPHYIYLNPNKFVRFA